MSVYTYTHFSTSEYCMYIVSNTSQCLYTHILILVLVNITDYQLQTIALSTSTLKGINTNE